MSTTKPIIDSGDRCPICRYNLTGVAGLRCPECGWTIDAEVLRRGGWVSRCDRHRTTAGVLATFNAGLLLFFAVVNGSQCTVIRPTPLLLSAVALVLGAGIHIWVAKCAFSRLHTWPCQKPVMWALSIAVAVALVLAMPAGEGIRMSLVGNGWWFRALVRFALLYPAMSVISICYIAHKRYPLSA